MPTPTYTALATVTLGTAVSSVTFSSIPATYRDLILISDCSTASNSGIEFRINGDSGSNYPVVMMRGTPAGVSSATNSGTYLLTAFSQALSNQRYNTIVQFMDYSATDKHKSVLIRTNYDNGASVEALAGRWASTSAMSSLFFQSNVGNFNAGSRFDLYGVIA
jgi:hypothetical protein